MLPLLRVRNSGNGCSLTIKATFGILVVLMACARDTAAQPDPSGRSLKLPVGPVTPAISMGASHGLILASDGSLWSWGENFVGWPVLGLGNMKRHPELHRIGNETNWVGISSSFTHSLTVKADGTLWAWGQNLSGQLGIGTAGRKDASRSSPVPSAPGSDWKQAAAGGSHSVALKRNGTLWAWGNNWAGQLGTGGKEKEVHAVVQVGSSTNWQKVWASGVQTVGLQSDGSLWFWGTLTGSSIDTNRFLAPTRVSPDTNWVDACFGYFNVFALKADGTLWSWGRNAGIYTGAPLQLLNPTPVRVGSEHDWVACAGSENFYQLLKKRDGSLWALDAYEHRIVDKPQDKPAGFTKIELRKDIVAFDVAGRGVTGVALTRDGEVWTWGKVLGEPAIPGDDEGVMRETPWQLPNLDPNVPP